jgi:hypothetical protein
MTGPLHLAHQNIMSPFHSTRHLFSDMVQIERNFLLCWQNIARSLALYFTGPIFVSLVRP